MRGSSLCSTAVAAAGLAVVLLLRLDQDDAPGGAAATRAMTEEVLYAAIGYADQPLIVPMQLVRMPAESAVDRFYAARPIADQLHAVGGWGFRHRELDDSPTAGCGKVLRLPGATAPHSILVASQPEESSHVAIRRR